MPPLDDAIEAARAELPRSNHYTEAHSAPLRRLLADRLDVPERLVHINAGSELILRQICDRFGDRVHLLTPTYPLFPEISRQYTETRLRPEDAFRFDLAALRIPKETTLAIIVNPNNPNGLTFNVEALPELLERHPETRFLVDEAFIGLAGESVVHLVPGHPNLLVTRTLSKAHSLAGFRVGYAVLPPALADDLNEHNDAYPLARPSEAAAIATLQNEGPDSGTRRPAAPMDGRAGGRAERARGPHVSRGGLLLSRRLRAAPRRAAGQAAQGARRLGPGFMRVTTALPEDNTRFLSAMRELL